MPVHHETVALGAVDAGSNAIRMAVAEAAGPRAPATLHKERVPVRLGHRVFTRRNLARETIREAADVFARFREIFDRYDTAHLRAVATSAARNARNRNALVDAVRDASGIELEIIDGAEEARLIRTAVLAALPDGVQPRLIMDLGGGSLEFNLLRDGELEYTATIPVGAVRLLEMFDASGVINAKQEAALRAYVNEVLGAHLPRRPDLGDHLVVACGGNALALSKITKTGDDLDVLHRKALRKELPALLARDLDQRIDAYGIKGDRADVIGVAAVVFDTLAERLGIASFHVPDVDLRDGILVDLARQQFHAKPRVGVRGRAKALLAAAREFGARYGYDNQHAEHVRRLAKSLFDQLKPLHHLGTEMRLALELGALLHDVGQSVNYRDHHRHGAYLVENGRLPGLSPSLRHIVSCLVRYHGKEKPGRKETELEMFDDDKREQVRMLIALLRVADGLDARHQQQVAGILVRVNDQRATIGLKPAELPESVAWSAARKAKLLEKVFSLKIDWDRSPA